MAIAFARINYHSRNLGHSSVNGAAYRSGTKLIDERTGEEHDYTNRKDIVFSEVLLPDGTDNKFHDRAFLWNEVERVEVRKNSQVAKDLQLALPREISKDKQIELAKNFAQYHFVNNGLAVDLSIHNDEEGNPHAHLYVTTRRLEVDRFSKRKARDLEPAVARGKVVEPEYWGEQWRDFQNQYFAANDIDCVVDARHLISTRHEGRVRYDNVHHVKFDNQLKKEATKTIILKSPDAILNHLGTELSVFSDRELLAFISKFIPSVDEANAAILKIKAHRDFIALGVSEDGRMRYTTRANYLREANLIDKAQALKLQTSHGVDNAIVTKALEGRGLNEEQERAVRYLAQQDGMNVVVGRAGTGKSSYVLNAARDMWQEAGFRVRGMAVSGIATKGLEESSGISSSILHGIKTQILEGRYDLTSNDILVMDEAGMTELRDMAVIVDAVHKAGAKLVLVGDHAQLQPVGMGAPFRAILSHLGFAELSQIMRQRDEGDRNASVQLSRGEIASALHYYNDKGAVYFAADESKAMAMLVANWQEGLTESSLSNRIILAHQTAHIAALNEKARAVMVEKGLVSAKGENIKTAIGVIPVAAGDRLLFHRNNRSLGISNGQFATVQSMQGSNITALIDGKKNITFDAQKFNDFSHGYAATVHKSQGVTVEDAFVYVGGKAWNRHLTYVALTRHQNNVSVYADAKDHKDIETLCKNMGCFELRDSVLDWPLSYAIRRGLSPDSLLGRVVEKLNKTREIIHDKWLYVVNYEAYLQKHANQPNQKASLKRREEARKVAAFVDLNRVYGKAWGEMTATFDAEDADKGLKLQGHRDYKDIYAMQLARNAMAYDINQNIGNYELALAHNGMSKDTLANLAMRHEHYQALTTFVRDMQRGRRVPHWPLAAKFYPAIKTNYGALQDIAEKHGTSSSSIITDLRAAYRGHGHHALIKSGRFDSKTLLDIKRYVQLDSRLRELWSDAIKSHTETQLSVEQTDQYHQQGVERDRLGHLLYQQKDKLQEVLALYEISDEKLKASSIKYEARERVKAFYVAPELHLSQLAAQIKADLKLHWPYLNEFDIDTKAVHLGNWRYQRRLDITNLSPEKRELVKVCQNYQLLQRQTANAWGKAFREDLQYGVVVAYQDRKTAVAHQWAAKRNAMAFSLLQQSKELQEILPLTKIDFDKLVRYAKAHENFEFVKRYQQETRPIHRGHMASYIQLNKKAHYSALSVLHIDQQQLAREARRQHYLTALRSLSPEQQDIYRLVDHFNEKRIEAGNAWSAVKKADNVAVAQALSEANTQVDARTSKLQQNFLQPKNAAEITKRLTKEAIGLTRQRNRVAAMIMQIAYEAKETDLSQQLSVDIERIKKAANEHHHYQMVFDYAHSSSIEQRDALAHEILSNKKYAREVFAQGVDWKTMGTHAAAHTRRLAQAQLSSEEFCHWQVVDGYQQARLTAGQAWSEYFTQKKLGEALSPEFEHYCHGLSNQRNQLAHTIVAAPATYAPYLEKVRIKPEWLEKDAAAHGNWLKKQASPMPDYGNAPVPSNASPIASVSVTTMPSAPSSPSAMTAYNSATTISAYEKPGLRYETVNTALMDMAEEFYSQVLGDAGKKSGNARRYGKNGSLNVTLSGSKAGLWCSFESGNGGGPLQLLMDKDVGLGLSYKEALEMGAQMSKLSLQNTTFSTIEREQRKAQETIKEAEEKAKKIKAARYYYESAQPITGTLGERYLREHRKIQSDISEIKFHSRILDTKQDKDGNLIKSHWPGLVAPLKNERGEIRGVHTILLDPTTAQKVDKKLVGVVKRSHGELKGNVALLQKGTSNEVIFAEGIETGLSLTVAAPKANIYATMGNIKNAENLVWIAKQHGAKTVYFAADNDVDNKGPLNAIHSAAQTFYDKYGIDSYISMPKSNNGKKYDFNDVLKEHGEAEVKNQLSQWKKVSVIGRGHLTDEKISHDTIKLLSNNKDKAKENKIEKNKNAPSDINKILLDGAKRIVALDKEIDGLRKGSATQTIENYEKLIKQRFETKDPEKIKQSEKQLNQFAINIFQDKKQFQQLKAANPKMSKILEARATKTLSKEKESGIER